MFIVNLEYIVGEVLLSVFYSEYSGGQPQMLPITYAAQKRSKLFKVAPIFAIKHKADTYSKHLIHSINDCVSF